MTLLTRDPARAGALVSAAVSLLAALAFFAAATAVGDYTWVARIGGAVWVFLLSMIILLPTVMPAVRKRLENPHAH